MCTYVSLLSDFSIEREDEDVYEGPRRQCTINGLLPGEKYLLKLLATNKAGVSLLVCYSTEFMPHSSAQLSLFHVTR